ncbi:hypothetical protein P7B02_07565 [Caulobacter segnis]|uniref:hypothetical protein n=1 Tax=Caulobacter segnis TaxID=88688 RepID=UPI00240FEE20|nr:hypothetical protein [Caulobacter segnis]MDG2521396.1 hypothetical protein [Caulobacter segnis]
MPHQNTQSPRATAQNAATGQTPGNDKGAEQNAAVRHEPRTYAAPNVADSTLAAPAAGEIADFMDEDGDFADESVALQQGGAHANIPVRTEALRGQGPKTRAANRKIVKSGSAD